MPAAAAYRSRFADRGMAALQLVERQRDWRSKRDAVRIDSVSATTNGKEHAFVAKTSLGAVDSANVRVEVYANSHDGGGPFQQEMVSPEKASGASHSRSYYANVSSIRPATDYTVRILHREAGLTVPLENNWILWHK